MTIGNITISDDLVMPLLAVLVMVSGYWFWRAYKRYRGRIRYTRADVDAIRTEAKRRL